MAWRHALVGCVVLLAGCGLPEPPPAMPSPVPPTATPVPKRPADTANAFLAAWQQGQYSAMYDLLSSAAQASTPRDVFVRRYANIHHGTTETKLTAQVTGDVDPPTNQVAFQVTHLLPVF